MNTEKIFSILLFGIIAFSIALFIARKMLVSKRNDEKPFEHIVQLSSTFIGTSIILNLVFQKIGYLYDLTNQYGIRFVKLFTLDGYDYSYNVEMLKVSLFYLAIVYIWTIISIQFSRMFAKNFYKNTEWQYHILKSIIFICLAIAFYPILSFILDNFYVVLENPTIR